MGSAGDAVLLLEPADLLLGPVSSQRTRRVAAVHDRGQPRQGVLDLDGAIDVAGGPQRRGQVGPHDSTGGDLVGSAADDVPGSEGSRHAAGRELALDRDPVRDGGQQRDGAVPGERGLQDVRALGHERLGEVQRVASHSRCRCQVAEQVGQRALGNGGAEQVPLAEAAAQ